MRFRPIRPDLIVAPGERVLAWATGADGTVVGGTRDALYLPHRIAWQDIEGADWDRDTSVLRVIEVVEWGAVRPEHTLIIDEPGRLLELVRERVTASIVLQRHVVVRGRRGLRVIARRAPTGRGETSWLVEYDAGIDPADPLVRLRVEDALAAAMGEVELH